MTYRYQELKKNPLILNIKPDLGAGPVADSKNLNEMEKLSFVRQFVERYVSFEAENFWQGQTALSFLMSPELREERLKEIARLRAKIQKNNISQKGRILSVEEQGSEYQVLLSLDLSESKAKDTLTARMKIGLGEAPRSLENPWGLTISRLEFSKEETAPPLDPVIRMQADLPSLLHFPCAVENFEVPPQAPVKVKITTFNVSEIQLFLTQPLQHEIHLKAYCRQKEFPVLLQAGNESVLLYKEISENAGQVRSSLAQKKPHKKSAYQKTIEDELGFVIEE
jgi:hypothetical protein